MCAARSNGLEGVDVVRPDNMQAAKMATEFLIKARHTAKSPASGRAKQFFNPEAGTATGGLLCHAGAVWPAFPAPTGLSSVTAISGRRQKQQKACCGNAQNISALVCHKASVALGAYFGIVLQRAQISGSEGVDTYYGQQVALIGFGDVPAGRTDRAAADAGFQLGA